jgi:Flp pilus assembly protein TadG
MDLLGRSPLRRRPETGATLVEFALVAPIVFLLIFGLIGGTFLVYQNSALHDGATAGARMASVEAVSAATLVTTSNGQLCESGQPVSIEKAVAQAAPLLTVNPAPLCEAGPTELTQSTVNGDVNIIVDCGGPTGCSSPTTTAVTLKLITKGLVAPIGLTYHMTATSQVPVLAP